MNQVVITGMSYLCALGAGQEAWARLLQAESGINYYQPFLELSSVPLGLVPRSFLGMPEIKLLDLDRLTPKIISLVLADAGLTPPLPKLGVVIGSSRSYQQKLEELAKQRILPKSPQDFGKDHPPSGSDFFGKADGFVSLLPHQLAITTACLVGSQGAVLAPMAACSTGIWALAQGYQLIQSGEYEQVIAGALESPISPLTIAGFNKMGALAATGAYPFDQKREGLVLGEGGALFILESRQSAEARRAHIYGEILGVGLTNDACYANSPGGSSGMRAIRQCLERSQLSELEIDYIHAHGTGTPLNDRHEALLIQEIFPQGVPVSSTKGATGHTLGASGSLGVAFCLMALQTQMLPPCVGLREPEFDLDFVRIARSSLVKHVLCFSFGFGGQNAVIALRANGSKQ